MALKPLRVPNIRHNLKGQYARTTRRKRLARFLTSRATALSYTAKEVWNRMALVGADALSKATTSIPVPRVRPTITGTTTSGQTLTASAIVLGNWGGTPVPTVTRQWYRDGVAIGGATASTYLLAAPDVGTRITLGEIGTNSAGSATSVSLQTATIA